MERRESRIVTALGSAQAVVRFTSTLRMLEGNVTVDRVAKRIALANVTPSDLPTGTFVAALRTCSPACSATSVNRPSPSLR